MTPAHEAVAARYPEFLIDSMGRKHPSIVRRAILSGAWDNGSLVREEAARIEREGRA